MENNLPITSSSSSSSSELFFSESEDSIDVLLEEQDVIIDGLRNDVKRLDEYSNRLLEELTTLKKYVKDDVVKCLRTLNTLIEKTK